MVKGFEITYIRQLKKSVQSFVIWMYVCVVKNQQYGNQETGDRDFIHFPIYCSIIFEK